MAATVLIGLWLGPAACGLLQAFAWLYGGHLGLIDWTPDRQVFAVAWTLLSPWVLVPMAFALLDSADEQDRTARN